MRTPDEIYENYLYDLFGRHSPDHDGDVCKPRHDNTDEFPIKRKRGRPHASESSRESEQNNYEAFLLVLFLQNTYRQREQTKRVPEEITDAFIRSVIEDFFQEASFNAVSERLREKKRQPLPKWDFPPV